MSLVFLLIFFLRQICGAENLSQQTLLQCLSTINMVFSDDRRGQDFDKKFLFDGVHSKEVDRGFF